MSLTNGKIGDLKLVHNANKDKQRANFPINIEGYPNTVFDKNVGSYKQWIVAANGFAIAFFVDETSMHSFMNYLSQYGFGKYPKEIIDILEKQANELNIKRK